MTNPSKQKGNSCERLIAQRLSTWWKQDFNRTPGSGNLRWNNNVWTYGDILPPTDFPGVIESKHYKLVNYNWLVNDPLSHSDGILSWFKQVLADRDRCLKETGLALIPLLIFKQNRGPLTLALEEEFFKHCNIETPNLLITIPSVEPFVIVDLEKFLSLVLKDDFIKAHRGWVASCVVPQLIDEVETP